MGIFSKIRTIISLAFLLAFAVIIYAILIIYTVANTEVTTVNVGSVSNINKEGFELEGGIMVTNNGVLSLHIKEITYKIIWEEDDLILANGSVEGAKVAKDENVTLTYSAAIPWTPGLAMGLDMTQGKASNMIVEGEVAVSHFGLYETRIPYKTKFDVGTYIQEKIKEQAPVIRESLLSLITNVGKVIEK